MSRFVFKVLKAGGSFHAIDYNARKERSGQARLVHLEGFGPCGEGRPGPGDLKRYLEQYAGRNRRIRHPQFHAILSVRGQGEEVSQLVRVAGRILEGLGYAGNPIAMYAHADTAHRHLHVITSRVGVDGRKVNDKFEGMRAQRILQRMLGVDEGAAFEKTLAGAMAYRCGNLRQFQLLMELQGYRSRMEHGDLRFFRHGTGAGSLSGKELAAYLAQPVDRSGLRRIQALTLEGARQHERTLVGATRPGTGGGYPLHSALTDHLHRTFGLQFVFFAAKGHARPYGYVVIDHARRQVYKGSEVLRLAQVAGEGWLAPGRDKGEREVGRGDGWPEGEKGKGMSAARGGEMVSAIDQILAAGERDLAEDAQRIEGEAKRRRKKAQGRG